MQSTRPLSSQPKWRAGLKSLFISVALLSIFFVVWSNRQYIADSISFWQYQPTIEIDRLASKIALSDQGKFTFYAAQPTISTGDEYNAVCNAHKEQHAAILGCYAANRIYLYDVTDERLNGIKEVTAAHEMLHAVYQRLPESEMNTINTLLDVEYEKLKNEPDYAERMAYYARAEPGQRHNELHSIVGTEIAKISPVLESHYQKYFTERSKIVTFYETYNVAFTELERKREQLSTQLDMLSADIERASAEYTANSDVLRNDIDSFNSRAESGDFSSQSQFNRERQALINRSSNLTLQLNEINRNVARFNDLKNQYNDTVTQSNDLYKSIDSSLTPAPKV